MHLQEFGRPATASKMKLSVLFTALLLATGSASWELTLYGDKKTDKAHGGVGHMRKCYPILTSLGKVDMIGFKRGKLEKFTGAAQYVTLYQGPNCKDLCREKRWVTIKEGRGIVDFKPGSYMIGPGILG